MSYFVTWTIDIDTAETPQEAAEMCRDMMLDPDSEAVVYEVLDSEGVRHIVDLMEIKYTDGCRFPGPPMEENDA